MSFRTFLFKIGCNIWSFLSNRIHREYEYIFSSGEKHGVRGSVRGDFYVKEIVDSLTKVQGEEYEYDPYVIEDKIYTWLRIPFIVEVEHYETFVEGLKTLHKAETCEIIENDDHLSVNAILRAGPLHFNIFAFAKLAYIEQLVTIKASLNYCKFNTNVSVDIETGRIGRLQSLCIEDFSGVNICITGLGSLSWLLSKFITLMIKLNHGITRNLVEFWIERYVSRLLPGYQFPTEGEYFNNASISENYSALDNVDKILQESSSTSRKQQFMPKNASNFWYSNASLLEGNVVNRGHNDSKSDADDVHLEFKFSKNDVILEDVEPLIRSDMTTCCVFFKYETEFLKKSATKDNGKHLPFKHSKDFLKGLLTTCGSSDIGGIAMLLEELEKSCTSDERTRSCNEILMKTFFKDYPNFISLTYTCEERKLETNAANEKIDSSDKAKVCVSQSEVTVETKDVVKVNVASTAGYQNEVTLNLKREFGDSNELLETVDQSYVLQSSTNNALQCSPLPMYSTADHIRSEINTTSNETNEEISKRMSDMWTYTTQPHLQRVQNTKNIDRMQNIESILKWKTESENIDESDCIGTKKFRYQSNEVLKLSIPTDCTVSQVIPDKPLKYSNVRKERSKNKTLKYNLYSGVIKKTNENEEKVDILMNTTSLRIKNINESLGKYNRTSIEELNAIGDAVCKCFENHWKEISPESDFFFSDRESNTISNLSERQKYELAEQLALLGDIKVEELEKEADKFKIDLEAGLKELDTKCIPNKNIPTTEFSSSFQSETANSNAFDISTIVKNFFEQNSVDKILSEQKKTTHSHLGADNESVHEPYELSLGVHENYINVSVSPKVEYCSNIIKGQPSDLIEGFLESFASLRKFDLPSKDSNNRTSITSDLGTQSTHNTMNDEVRFDEFEWGGWSDGTCDSSFSSYMDTSMDIHPDFVKHDLCRKNKSFAEIDYLKKETDRINRQSTEASIYSKSEENIPDSGNSSLETLNIKMLDICKGSLCKVNEEQVVEIEKSATTLPEANKTATPEEQIVSINETKIYSNIEKSELGKLYLAKSEELYVKYNFMSDLSFEKLYDTVLNSEETNSNDILNVEHDVSKNLSSLADDAVKRNKCTNITEKIQILKDKLVETDKLKLLEVSSNEQSIVETSDTFPTIQDEKFEDIEQTNLLRSMFEEFVHQREEAELNSLEEANVQALLKKLE